MGKEIGIDFGTTNTVVSYVNKKGRLRQLAYDGENIIPTVIYFRSENDYVIGKAAKNLMAVNPQAGVDNFKLKIGDKDWIIIQPDEGPAFRRRRVHIATLFFNKIIAGVQDRLVKEFDAEGFVDRAVITVPAKFNPSEKGCAKKAAIDANLDMVKLAPEPTAAAVAFESDFEEEMADRTVLVYDFGGGTFDVSVIRRNNGRFEEIATGGDKELGGNVLTEKLMGLVLEQINAEFGLALPLFEDDFDEDEHGISSQDYKKNMVALKNATNTIKEALSDTESAEADLNVLVPNGNELFTVEISRDEFESLVLSEIKRTAAITLQTRDEALKQGVDHIDQIVLAGGSSNIPLVKTCLQEVFGDQEDIVYCDDVSTLISRGAAVLARRDTAFESIAQTKTCVQMGITATEGVLFGQFQTIIGENEPLPCTRKKIFQLAQDGQSRLEIRYYERDIKNWPNASRVGDKGISQIDVLMIENLPEGLKANECQVEVEFTAQKDGSLDMSATLVDMSGAPISSGQLSYRKQTDLE